MSSRKEQKEQARARRLEEEARLKTQAKRKRRLTRIGLAVVALAVAGVVVAAVATSATSSSRTTAGRPASLATLGKLQAPGPAGALGPEGVPVPTAPELASGTGATGSPIDGIQCNTSEQTIFHIHAHLTLFVSGTARQVPFGIGIPGARATASPAGQFVSSGSCFYWLHTHAADGIIHIESPVQRTFTLGNFFDVWGQQLAPDELGPVRGPVTALYDGRVFRGNPRDVPLTAHAQIQLEVGRPLIAAETVTFPGL